jgi:hypothetical protein
MRAAGTPAAGWAISERRRGSRKGEPLPIANAAASKIAAVARTSQLQ